MLHSTITSSGRLLLALPASAFACSSKWGRLEEEVLHPRSAQRSTALHGRWLSKGSLWLGPPAGMKSGTSWNACISTYASSASAPVAQQSGTQVHCKPAGLASQHVTQWTAARSRHARLWHTWLPILHRDYATEAQPPVRLGVKERLLISPGMIADPYTGRQPLRPLWFASLEGWKGAYSKSRGWLATYFALAFVARYIPGSNYRKFKETAMDLYEQVNSATANGDLTGLSKLVTPELFSMMSGEVKRRKAAGWKSILWQLEEPPTITSSRLVRARVVRLSPESQVMFCQVTLMLPSKQRFAACDKTGKQVAGDLTEVLDVREYWVFERKFLMAKGKDRQVPHDSLWRVAARLEVEG